MKRSASQCLRQRIYNFRRSRSLKIRFTLTLRAIVPSNGCFKNRSNTLSASLSPFFSIGSSDIKGLNSQERAISIDLITTGVTIGIWKDEDEAMHNIKQYWSWFRGEIKIGESPLVQCLKRIVKQEELNAHYNNSEVTILNQLLKASCNDWQQKGYLLEKPNSKAINRAMHELGYRLVVGGKWIKS